MKRRKHDRRKRRHRKNHIGGMTEAVAFLAELLVDILLNL